MQIKWFVVYLCDIVNCKVETIGDAYVIACGVPERIGDLHAPMMANLTLNLSRVVDTMTIPFKEGTKLELRYGLHTGTSDPSNAYLLVTNNYDDKNMQYHSKDMHN